MENRMEGQKRWDQPKRTVSELNRFLWASSAGHVSDYPWSRNLAVLQGHALTKDPGVSG
jgi:hypothetical protein